MALSDQLPSTVAEVVTIRGEFTFVRYYIIILTLNIIIIHSDPPTGLSAMHTTSITIRVYWTPSTAMPTGYEITYFAGAGDTTGTAVSVSGGNTSSHEISNLSATVTYRVSIVSVNGTTRSDSTGPVLAARSELCWSSQT